jgi:pyruvate dehydrogenase E2 component (dihydrolipoamide acetyltransferase)
MKANGPLKSSSPRILISPRARRAVNARGLDASQIQGTGPNGRIVDTDVAAFSAPPKSASPALPKLSVMRQTIARRTAESFSTAPHFYLRTELDADALLECRAGWLESVEKECGVRLTLTDLILKAMALALRDRPKFRRIWEGGTIRSMESVDIGLVVGLEDGLMIPILRNVDRLSLADLARQRSQLTEAARKGTLSAEQTQGGSITLSNLGHSVVDDFAAVLPPPHSAILAVGRVVPRPFVDQGKLCARPTIKMCLSVDHRVLDGAPAADYLGRLAELIAKPLPLSEAA